MARIIDIKELKKFIKWYSPDISNKEIEDLILKYLKTIQ